MSSEIIPSLLDRLTSDDPAGPAERPELLAISYEAYVESVVRDLAWLLNTRALSNTSPFTRFDYERGQRIPKPIDWEQAGREDVLGNHPEIYNSVLGYGTGDPGLEGTAATSEESCAKLGASFIEAIKRFEPRIEPLSLKIEDLAEQDPAHPEQRRPFPCARFKITARLRLLRSEFSIATSFDISANQYQLSKPGYGP